MECRSSKNELSIVVCTQINKSLEFQNLKFKIPYDMNYLGGKIVRNAEPKRRRPLKKGFTAELPRKRPAKANS